MPRELHYDNVLPYGRATSWEIVETRSGTPSSCGADDHRSIVTQGSSGMWAELDDITDCGADDHRSIVTQGSSGMWAELDDVTDAINEWDASERATAAAFNRSEDVVKPISPPPSPAYRRAAPCPETHTDISLEISVAGSSRTVPVKRPRSEGAEDGIIRASKIPRLDTRDPEDEPLVIAHDSDIEKMMETHELGFGVGWELARLVSTRKRSMSDLRKVQFDKLSGSNDAVAPLTASMVFNKEVRNVELGDPAFAQERAAQMPWKELDLETEYMSQDPDAGLGNSAVAPGWYGGKIIFRAVMREDTCRSKDSSHSEPCFHPALEPATLGASTRFTRTFGSTAFLRVKVPTRLQMKFTKDKDKEKWVRYFRRPVVLWGQVYRAFFAKDENVFFFRTNEALDDTGSVFTPLGARGMSLIDFITHHNPLRAGDHQLMCKWSARFALGLSNSVPGPKMMPENIKQINDIISPYDKSDQTDGCGFGNKALHLMLYHQFGWDPYAFAVQFRLGGMKGLVLEEPTPDRCTEPVVQYRPSQLKIKVQAEHPSHLIFDVVRPSRLRTQSRISFEIIRNLEDNGVPVSVLKDLLKAKIHETVESLTTWEGPDAMFKLWVALERLGGVLTARHAREAAGEARALGYGYRGEDDDDDEYEDEDALDSGVQHVRSVAWWTDQTSGCPSALEETVMALLDSGFTPINCSVLRDKLKMVLKTRIENLATKIRFNIPQSATAFCVPDPCGVLGPDEIFLKSSRQNLKTDDGADTDFITGDVLITRNPCKIPTDVRKVKIVDYPLLHKYVDVVVCSTHPKTGRLLEILAGGDYDGDTTIVIWDKRLVEPFKNADLSFAKNPRGFPESRFTRNGQTVGDFVVKYGEDNLAPHFKEIQHYLLGNLRDCSILGKYSNMHDHAIHMLGYSHPRSVMLAYTFNTLMDSGKSGWILRETVFMRDYKQFNHPRGLEWKDAGNKKKRQARDKTERTAREFNKHLSDESNVLYLERPKQRDKYNRGPEVMDVLYQFAREESNALLMQLEKTFAPLSLGDTANSKPPDMDLAKPWLDAVDLAQKRMRNEGKDKSLHQDLGVIADHVHKVYDRRYTGGNFTSKPIEQRQDELRALSKLFAEVPPVEKMQCLTDENIIRRYAASFAYYYDWEERSSKEGVTGDGWSRFPFNVAFRELCHIKAQASGTTKTVTYPFYERFKLGRLR